jgi:CRISPR-associated protein Csd2
MLKEFITFTKLKLLIGQLILRENYINEEINNLYEVYDYKHALTLLKNEFINEYSEIVNSLLKFRFSLTDLLKPGGNETNIPKLFSGILRPQGWREMRLEAELSIYEVNEKQKKLRSTFNHGTHKVDYVKGRVAFDLEWNSKDQTFDRDLYAFRAFFDYNTISLGILVTRSQELNILFEKLKISHKYGASTTHIGKLLPRLDAGRNGGCPVLVFGITSKLLSSEK